MIEILAPLVVGALVVEWWDTYHADKPVPPAKVAAPPPVVPLPVARVQAAVQLPPEMPQVVAAPAQPAWRQAGAQAAPRRAPASRPARTPESVPALAAAIPPVPVAPAPTPAPTPAPAPALAPLPAALGDAALRLRAGDAMAAGHPAQAAADWAELLRRQPGDDEARRSLVLALQAAGLPELALELADAESGLEAAERAALLADVAARAVDLAVRGEPQPGRNRLLRERAEAALARACAYAEAKALAPAQQRCRSLRVVYLGGTGQHDAAAAAYAAGPEGLDDAAHTAAARSLLALNLPDAADAAWARRSAAAAAAPDVAIDRLFVREELRAASDAIEGRIAVTPTRLTSPGGESSEPNWERLILEGERQRALAYRGRLPEAISGTAALLAAAPADVGLRLQLARFYRYDDKRDRADIELDKAAALQPGSEAALHTRIAFAIEDGEYHDAQRGLAALDAAVPPTRASAELARDYQVARAAYIEAAVGATRSDGPALLTPSKELQQEVTIYSPAWVHHGDTRVFAFEQGSVGDFGIERPSPLRLGMGVQTRRRDWDARLAVHTREGVAEAGAGASLSGGVRLGDAWRADVDLQSDSDATPLLAWENGIEAWSAAVGVEYHVGAGHEYRLEGRQLDLDDGNKAESLDFTGRQPLYADAPHALSLIERFETTANDLAAVPYFSPARMSAGELQLEYRGVLHALGDRRWEHVLTLGAGRSRQTGFGPDDIGDLRWEHLWTVNAVLELGAGAEWRRRVYDGTPEDQTEIFASLLWRLP